MQRADTIVAAATPQGRGALAIIRISGVGAFPNTAQCLFERKSFEQAHPREIQIYKVKDPVSRRMLDEITAVKYAGPRSFTGEDMVEIVCHGGPRVVKEIKAALLAAGCRGAGRGEFTRRALENGKLDLLHAEAIRGMIESQSEAELNCSRKLFTAEGHQFRQWREELLEISAEIESHIEFEEETGKEAMVEVRKKIEALNSLLIADLRKKEKIRILEKGLRIVIAGPANAGKSSFFNLMVGFARSIVHQEPGTTRDLVSETVCIGNHDVVLVDSAGIRESVQEVEITGIGLTRRAISDAGAVIWVTSAEEMIAEREIEDLQQIKEKNLLVILNKIDRCEGEKKLKAFDDAGFDTIPISIKMEKNCEKLFTSIRQKVDKLHEEIDIPDLLFNERQEKIGRTLKKEIEGAISEWDRPEIAAHFLRRAIGCLDEFFGTANPEEVMNRVFEKFCIGK